MAEPTVIRTRDGIFVELEEGQAPDAPEVQALVQQERVRRRQASPEFQDKVAKDQAVGRARFAAEEASRPLHERILTNLGAGFHRLGQAVTFADKADVEEANKYRQSAAETMPGGQAVQMLGEALPTLAVPAGAIGAGLSRLPMAGAAIGRAAGTRVGNVANVGGTSAALGALTTPGDAEDRLLGAALSGAGGAALPASVAAVQGARRMVTNRGGQLATGERFLRGLEQESPTRADELLGSLRQAGPTRQTLAGVTRPTAAQLTGDPVLRELEVGARTKQPASFAAGDEAAAQGRADVLSRIAGTPGDLAQAEAQRAAATAPMRNAALEAASRFHGQGFERPVLNAVADIARGESRSNPAVQSMVRYVMGELQQGVTPGQLYTVRKTLTTGVPHGTELGAAISQSRAERMRLVDAIDEALDVASAGQWGQYMQRFQELSQPVTSRRAGQAIQRDFASSANTTLAGDPVLTASKLRKAVQTRGQKQFGGRTVPRITPAERAQLEAVADSAEASTRARMSQGLEGSRTAGNIAAGDNMGAVAQGIGSLVGGVPGQVVSSALPRWARGRDERILAQLLQDPELLALMIERARAARATTQTVGDYGGRYGRAATDILED